MPDVNEFVSELSKFVSTSFYSSLRKAANYHEIDIFK